MECMAQPRGPTSNAYHCLLSLSGMNSCAIIGTLLVEASEELGAQGVQILPSWTQLLVVLRLCWCSSIVSKQDNLRGLVRQQRLDGLISLPTDAISMNYPTMMLVYWYRFGTNGGSTRIWRV